MGREYNRVYQNGPTTGLGEGAKEIAVSAGVDLTLEQLADKKIVSRKVPIVASILGIVHAVKDIPAWLKKWWEKEWDYRSAIGLCEAAYGKP